MPHDHPREPAQRLMTPVALAVACPDEQLLLWAMVVEDLGVELSPVDLVDLPAVARVTVPAAILITEDVMTFDPEGFGRIAQESNCPLIVMPSVCFDENMLRCRLGPAVVAWRARRHRIRSGIRHRSPSQPERSELGEALPPVKRADG
jgi:hypothetical protein